MKPRKPDVADLVLGATYVALGIILLAIWLRDWMIFVRPEVQVVGVIHGDGRYLPDQEKEDGTIRAERDDDKRASTTVERKSG